MIVGEPWLDAVFEGRAAVRAGLSALVIAAVPGAGWWTARHRVTVPPHAG